MLKLFRLVSLVEGLSYIAILSVTLGLISRDYVSILGMTHGLLFMVYVLMSLSVGEKLGWPLKVWLPIFTASLVPFAFIGVDWFLRREAAASQ